MNAPYSRNTMIKNNCINEYETCPFLVSKCEKLKRIRYSKLRIIRSQVNRPKNNSSYAIIRVIRSESYILTKRTGKSHSNWAINRVYDFELRGVYCIFDVYVEIGSFFDRQLSVTKIKNYHSPLWSAFRNSSTFDFFCHRFINGRKSENVPVTSQSLQPTWVIDQKSIMDGNWSASVVTSAVWPIDSPTINQATSVSTHNKVLFF